MDYAYYPGCTLIEKEKEFNAEIKYIAREFGIELVEIKDWICCGAVLSTSVENLITLSSPIRNLNYAKQNGYDKLVVACSACFNVLKRANEIIKKKDDVREKINLFCENDYKGEVSVLHILEVIRDDIGYEKIKERLKRKSTRKVAPYYGCLLLRPKEIAIDSSENPKILQGLLETLGCEIINTPYQNECCGAYLQISSPYLSSKLSENILTSSQLKGADTVVTSCPLCFFNLKNASDGRIEVCYFSKVFVECLR